MDSAHPTLFAGGLGGRVWQRCGGAALSRPRWWPTCVNAVNAVAVHVFFFCHAAMAAARASGVTVDQSKGLGGRPRRNFTVPAAASAAFASAAVYVAAVFLLRGFME